MHRTLRLCVRVSTPLAVATDTCIVPPRTKNLHQLQVLFVCFGFLQRRRRQTPRSAPGGKRTHCTNCERRRKAQTPADRAAPLAPFWGHEGEFLTSRGPKKRQGRAQRAASLKASEHPLQDYAPPTTPSRSGLAEREGGEACDPDAAQPGPAAFHYERSAVSSIYLIYRTE